MGLITTTQQDYYDSNNHGNYQFTSLDDIINQFIIAYVGEEKIISKIKRADVAFHAQRALQELSFDTFKSCKSQEITVPASLMMTLPQDYVNYVKLVWADSSGIEHIIYPTSKTSNPINPLQNSDGEFKLQADGTMTTGTYTVVLDGEYSNILVGMRVSSPSIDTNALSAAAFVNYTSVSGGITTIELATSAGVLITPSFGAGVTTSTETLTFTNSSDGSLILEEQSSYILEGITYTAGENTITAASTADASQITVGMLISHIGFSEGTIVVDVNGAIITLSSNSSTSIVSTSAGATDATFILTPGDSTTWANYKSNTSTENNDDYQDNTWWPYEGERYGLDPQYAQSNGSFYMDCYTGKIHFSSNLSGKTVTLKYISDSLGTDGEMQVHKFAEEAMYKWIAYGILSTRANTQEYIIQRFKKEKFAETRKAKLRLSNIKLEEITQVLRGKSKHIKH